MVCVLAACNGDPTGPTQFRIADRVAAGANFSCALTQDAQVMCWGDNDLGKLGDGTLGHRDTPGPIRGNRGYQSLGIHGQGANACAVTLAGEVYCWGENDFGQLGDGTLNNSPVPVRVATDIAFRRVSAGWRFACGIAEDDRAYCWGRGVWGQLGDGRAEQSLTPVAVAGDLRFRHLEAGTNNLACGVTLDGEAYCWGLNWTGGVGAATTETCSTGSVELSCARTPLRVGGERTYSTISAGNSYACGIDTAGALWCWGLNTVGQLGVATTESCAITTTGVPCAPTPVRVPSATSFKAVSAGGNHTCAVTSDGEALCWGRNDFGEIGNGFINSTHPTPVRVETTQRFVSISAGTSHTCGETEDNTIFCWGVNDLGQVGDGTNRLTVFPSQVVGGL